MPDTPDVLCHGTNLDSSPCRRHATPGTTACRHHNPARVEERARRLEEQAAQVRATAVLDMTA